MLKKKIGKKCDFSKDNFVFLKNHDFSKIEKFEKKNRKTIGIFFSRIILKLLFANPYDSPLVLSPLNPFLKFLSRGETIIVKNESNQNRWWSPKISLWALHSVPERI